SEISAGRESGLRGRRHRRNPQIAAHRLVMSSLVVAIDGPAAAGKGTLARRVAERFGFAHLGTGKLYRATAFLVLEAGSDAAAAKAATEAASRVEPAMLSDPRLLSEPVAQASSVVAAIPEVRGTLLRFQRTFAAHPPPPARGAVLDGRDIGTAVCPDAN